MTYEFVCPSCAQWTALPDPCCGNFGPYEFMGVDELSTLLHNIRMTGYEVKSSPCSAEWSHKWVAYLGFNATSMALWICEYCNKEKPMTDDERLEALNRQQKELYARHKKIFGGSDGSSSK